jgi:hypothetical protein
MKETENNADSVGESQRGSGSESETEVGYRIKRIRSKVSDQQGDLD